MPYADKETQLAKSRQYKNKSRKKVQERKAGSYKPSSCEICGGNGGERGICFDHDHLTGRFRGWLCGRCNTAIGLLEERTWVLRKLADYLEEHALK